MARFHTLGDLDVAGRRVLVRADLNVPLDGNRVGDGMRIARLAPTILELARRQARTIVLSHLGRPKGTVVPEMSLHPVVAPLSEALEGRPVAFAEDCVGDAAETVVNGLEDGGVALLENLRFHGGEETNDEDFARRLASLGELYVNDAFSCSHRAHASITALARLLPAAAGRGMEAELRALGHALDSPARPLAAVVGGAKVSTKIALLENLVAKVDVLIIGGGMANTFLAARGIEVGASLCEEGHFETARRVLAAAEVAGCEVVLPVDAVVAAELAPGAATQMVPVGEVPTETMILDIGPASAKEILSRLASARTLVWNGPLGAFETPPFDSGTTAVARVAARLTRAGKLNSIAGGGDTLAALNRAGALDDFSYVSTAGGAFLEWLEGKELPGVKALEP
jgi:phosphoglycerate kinase